MATTTATATTAAAATTAASTTETQVPDFSSVRISDQEFVVINWDEAMTQVSDDVEFLREVLADLIDESMTAKEELRANIEGRNFENVMKAAHRIKGSASYLCVDRMREISLHMQLYGHAGKEMEQDAESIARHAANLKLVPAKLDDIWKILTVLFEQFQTSIEDLKIAISARFPEDA